MGKDSIRLLAAIKKCLNFQTQRDRKIQGKINSNSLGNRWLSYRKGGAGQEDRRIRNQ